MLASWVIISRIDDGWGIAAISVPMASRMARMAGVFGGPTIPDVHTCSPFIHQHAFLPIEGWIGFSQVSFSLLNAAAAAGGKRNEGFGL